jgi:hypothetical protein
MRRRGGKERGGRSVTEKRNRQIDDNSFIHVTMDHARYEELEMKCVTYSYWIQTCCCCLDQRCNCCCVKERGREMVPIQEYGILALPG